MFSALMIAVIDVSFPMVSRSVMYDLIPNGKYSLMFTVMSIVAIAYVLRSFFYYIMTYKGHTFGAMVEADIRSDLFSHMQSLDFEFYDRTRTGTLMSRLTGDLFEITELAHHGPEDIVIAVLTIIGSLSFMFSINLELAIVVACLIPVFMIITMINRRRMARASSNVKKKLGVINSDIESGISGIKTSKAFANEHVDKQRFHGSNKAYRKAKSEFFKAMGRFNASQEFFICIMPVAIITYGANLMMKGEMNYIDLITFTLFTSAFITPIRRMSNFAEILTNGFQGLRRFSELMDIKPQIEEREDAKDLTVEEGNIKIDDISFSYGDDRKTIKHISLNIAAGEKVAIVGPSGGGKTTLCHLIPRFYEVTSGRIRIDSVDIADVNKKSLRANIGIVQQDVFIFADTIKENIRYGNPSATFEEVVEAAKKAKIYDDIMNMPEGFDTNVGERGTKLSGGQKQRVSIARILLKNPKILILDEATSALDTITEQYIQEAFDELAKGRTSLVIAHRLATVKNADRIILVRDGEIVEQGTHEELMNLGGEYARLFNTQKLV